MATVTHTAGEVVETYLATLHNGPLWHAHGDNGTATAMLPQLRYFHERAIDAMATALDRIQPLEARYRFSQMLVRQSRVLLTRSREETEFVPLTAVEGIANQLHAVAANDWRVFLALLEPLYTTVFPIAEWRDRVASGQSAAVNDADRAYLEAASDLTDLSACLALVEPPTLPVAERIRSQTFLLMEMASLLDRELAEATRSPADDTA